jgi:hypothetical protein
MGWAWCGGGGRGLNCWGGEVGELVFVEAVLCYEVLLSDNACSFMKDLSVLVLKGVVF